MNQTELPNGESETSVSKPPSKAVFWCGIVVVASAAFGVFAFVVSDRDSLGRVATSDQPGSPKTALEPISVQINDDGFVDEESRTRLLQEVVSIDEDRRLQAFQQFRLLPEVARTELLSSATTVKALVPLLPEYEWGLKHDSGDVLKNWFASVPRSARQPLIEALESPDPNLQKSALRFWGLHRVEATGSPVFEPQLVPVLLRILQGLNDRPVSLADTASEDQPEWKVRQIEHERVEIMRSALELLGRHLDEIRDPATVIDVALELLNHQNYQIRYAAVSSFERAPPQFHDRIVSALMGLLEVESDGLVIPATCHILWRIRDERAVEALSARLGQQPLFTTYGGDRREMSDSEIASAERSIRKSICLALEHQRHPRVIHALRAQLPLNDPGVVTALGRLGDTSSRQTFLKLLKSPDVELRLAAAQALGRVADQSSFDPLAEELSGELDSDVASLYRQEKYPREQLLQAVSYALTTADAARAAKLVVQSLGRPSLRHVEMKSWPNECGRDPRYGALQQVSRLSAPLLIDALRQKPGRSTGDDDAPKEGTSDEARYRRTPVLAEMLRSRWLYAEDEQPVTELLIDQVQSSEPVVPYLALRALYERQSPAAIDSILRLLESNRPATEPYNSVNKLAALSLVWIADTETAGDRIVALASHPEVPVREAVARVLVKTGHSETAATLLALLFDKETGVKAAAAEQLGVFGDQTLGRELLDRLKATQSDAAPVFVARETRFVVALIQSLGMLKYDQATETLAHFLTKSDPELRAAAMVALMQLDDDRGLAAFCKAVRGYEKSLRQHTFRHASKVARLASQGHGPHPLNRPEAVDALLPQLADESSNYELMTMVAILSGIPTEAGQETLRTYCRNSDQDVRSVAVSAFLTTDAPDRFETLSAFLNARGRGGQREALKKLNTLLETADVETQRSAISGWVDSVLPLLDDSENRWNALTDLEDLVPQAESERSRIIEALQSRSHQLASHDLFRSRILAALSRLTK